MIEENLKMAGQWTERVLSTIKNSVVNFFNNFSRTTAETFAWLAIIVINCSTIPGFLAVKVGMADKMPPIELVALMWVGLLLYFIRSAILRDMLAVVTIGFGFAVQALFLGYIFFQ